jgi:hypothetical protein
MARGDAPSGLDMTAVRTSFDATKAAANNLLGQLNDLGRDTKLTDNSNKVPMIDLK